MTPKPPLQPKKLTLQLSPKRTKKKSFNTTIQTTLIELCPLADSRTSSLWLQLITVHFTTLTAFCHLLSLYGEGIFTVKLLFYFLVPFNLITQQVVSILVLVVGLFWQLPEPAAVPKRSETTTAKKLYRGARLFYGKIPEWEWRHRYAILDNNSRRTPRLSPAPTGRGTQPRACSTKTLGRFIIASTFLAQCIGTIHLYQRRAQNNAVAKADSRFFQLACSGLVTAVLTLLTVAKEPPFAELVPNITREKGEEKGSFLDKRLIGIGDISAEAEAEVMRSYCADQAALPSLFKNGSLAFLTYIVANKFKLLGVLRALFSADFWTVRGVIFTKITERDASAPGTEYAFELQYMFIAAVSSAGLACLVICGRSSLFDKRVQGTWDWGPSWT
ncbi:hypothetical protein G7Y89_g13421 [Cudoniella acicularis]|uniref:Uncharacterized protein n=1 Tax=Cudoniella acicularis TaxID=354080 RepID=A0A8H4VWG2_9HELO|nr:hypothetical protein G7Y89_g13421 [Cudoniella acicularis]